MATLNRKPLEKIQTNLKGSWASRKNVELEAREFFRFFASRINLNLQSTDEIALCVIEGSINALEHGKAEYLEMELAFNGETVEVRIKNTRAPDKPAPKLEIPEEPREIRGKRGWGLHILKKFLDDFYFEEENSKTVLVMRKGRENP